METTIEDVRLVVKAPLEKKVREASEDPDESGRSSHSGKLLR